MAYLEHLPFKPEKLAETAVTLLDEQLLVPQTFAKKSIDQFRGTKDDTVTWRVPGVVAAQDIPWRDYGVTAIDLQQYTETTVSVKFGGEAISAVGIADIQAFFDLDPAGVGDLMTPQAEALARHINHKAIGYLRAQEHEVVLGGIENDIKANLFKARRVMNAFRQTGQRIVLVGAGVEELLLQDPQLTRALEVGESSALEAVKQAKIGDWLGFTFVTCLDLPDDEAYIYTPGAHNFLNAAPPVPSSAVIGGTASVNGVALRWVKDYDSMIQQERSVMNTWYGFDRTLDSLVGWDETAHKAYVSAQQYFVRGMKMTIGGTSKAPAVGSELARITGIDETKIAVTAPAPTEPTPTA